MKRAMRANSHKGESKIGVANDYYGEPAFAGRQVPRPTGVIRAGLPEFVIPVRTGHPGGQAGM